MDDAAFKKAGLSILRIVWSMINFIRQFLRTGKNNSNNANNLHYPNNPKFVFNVNDYRQLMLGIRAAFNRQLKLATTVVDISFKLDSKRLLLLQLTGKNRELNTMMTHIITCYRLCDVLGDPITRQNLRHKREAFIRQYKYNRRELVNYVGDGVARRLMVETAASSQEKKMIVTMLAASGLFTAVLRNCILINSTNKEFVDIKKRFNVIGDAFSIAAYLAIMFIKKYLANKPAHSHDKLLQAGSNDRKMLSRYVAKYLGEIKAEIANGIDGIVRVPQPIFRLLLITECGDQKQQAEIVNVIESMRSYIDALFASLQQFEQQSLATHELEELSAVAKMFRLLYMLSPKQQPHMQSQYLALQNIVQQSSQVDSSKNLSLLHKNITHELQTAGILKQDSTFATSRPVSILAVPSFFKHSSPPPSKPMEVVTQPSKNAAKSLTRLPRSVTT